LNTSPERLTPFQTAATVAAGGALALCLVVVLSRILPAVLWAGVLTIALWPSYSKVYVWRGSHLWQRLIAPLLFTTLVGLMVAAPVVLAALEIGRETQAGMAGIENARQVGVPIPAGMSELPWVGTRIADWWNTNLSDPKDAAVFFGQVGPGQLLGLTRSVGPLLLHRTLLFVVTLMTLFFLFRDGNSLAKSLEQIGRTVLGARSAPIARHVVEAVHGTVDGLVLVGLAEGAVIGIGYFLAGLPHAIVFAIATGILAIIPFGAPLAFCFASLILFSMGKAVLGVSLIVFGFLVVFVADHFIRPFLIGGASKIPFLLVLLGLFGGVSSLGLVGLFVGPALMAVLVAVWREVSEQKTA
jgi:predicted PurR-regulated permease PerM